VSFLVFPIRMEQPAVVGDSLSANALRWVYAVGRGGEVKMSEGEPLSRKGR
jgi:hypothetical protein